MKKLIIPIVLVILLAVSVFGTWVTPGNAGLEDASNLYTGYSLNYPNPLLNVTNSSYNMCAIAESSIEPLAYDFNGDNFFDAVVGSGSSLFVYDRTCNLLSTIELAEPLNKAGIYIGNPDGDAYVDIIVGVDKGINTYEWNNLLSDFVLNINLTNSSISTLAYIACPFLSDMCYGFSAQTPMAYIINFSSYKISRAENYSYADSAIQNNSIYQYRALPSAYSPLTYRIPMCFGSSFSDIIKCDIYNDKGENYGPYTIYSYGSTTSDTLTYMSAYYARLGGNLKLFISSHQEYRGLNPDLYFDGNFIVGIGDYLPTFTNILLTAGNVNGGNYVAGNSHSNWAVGDINKDGSNEACYIHADNLNANNPTTYNNTYFTCLDEYYSAVIDIEVSGVLTINNFVIADFYPDNDYMCIGTYEGVFCPINPYGTLEPFYSTSFSGNRTGFPIAIPDGTAGSPMLIYADGTAGFIIYSSLIGSSCSDGICDAYENLFTCPQDCNTSTTAPSIEYTEGTAPEGAVVGLGNGVLCASGYLEYGRCSLKPGGRDCTADSECLSGDCDGAICSDAGAWAGIDNYINLSFGSDTTSLTFISFFIIIALTAGIIIVTKGSLAGVVAGVGVMMTTMIFFTIVGWLPIFFLFGLIMLVIIVIVLLMMFNNGG